MTKRKATEGHLVAMGNHQTTQRSPTISRPRAAWALDSFIELYLTLLQISHCIWRQAEGTELFAAPEMELDTLATY